MKKQTRYYVGTGCVLDENSNYTRASLVEAIDRAKKMVETDGLPRPVVCILAVVKPRPKVDNTIVEYWD